MPTHADDESQPQKITQLAQERDIALQAGEQGVEWQEMKTYLLQRLEAIKGQTKAARTS